MRLLPSLIALLCAASLQALPPAKFDIASRARLVLDGKPASRTSASISAIVTLADGADALALETYGVGVSPIGRGMAVVRGPLSSIAALAEDEIVLRISLSREVHEANNLSRAAIGADLILESPGIEGRTYTGKGVLAGLYDTGFDFKNPAFRTSDGHSRALRVWDYTDGCAVYDIPVMIDALVTENAEKHHGSHVLGTMAGNYPGSEYNGMAPDTSLAIACGTLDDASISAGVAAIAALARDKGMPCVINLSIADFLGPRDGTDDFSRALAAATSETEDAILVVASGNYRGLGRSLGVTFSEAEPALRTFLVPEGWIGKGAGAVAVWSGDTRPLALTLVVMDSTTGNTLASYKVDPSADSALMLVTDNYEGQMPDEDDGIELVADKAFSAAYDNSHAIAFYASNEDTNGRPCFYISFDLAVRKPDNQSRRTALGLIVEGEDGQSALLSLDGSTTELRSLWVDGWSEGRDDNAISSIAFTDGAVCVGAYCTRLEWETLAGEVEDLSSQQTLGDIASWSSRGVSVDGTRLPHVAAPGCAVVSVMSTPYQQLFPGGDWPVLSLDTDTRTDYWSAAIGTSMAAPAVAGGIALWLEADPSLTYRDVLDIISHTADTDAFTEASPDAFGAGKFNAAAGLREVLARRAALAGPSAVLPSAIDIVTRNDGSMEVSLPGVDAFTVIVHDLSGRAMLSAEAGGGVAIIPAGRLEPGVYIVSADRFSKKICVRM